MREMWTPPPPPDVLRYNYPEYRQVPWRERLQLLDVLRHLHRQLRQRTGHQMSVRIIQSGEQRAREPEPLRTSAPAAAAWEPGLDTRLQWQRSVSRHSDAEDETGAMLTVLGLLLLVVLIAALNFIVIYCLREIRHKRRKRRDRRADGTAPDTRDPVTVTGAAPAPPRYPGRGGRVDYPPPYTPPAPEDPPPPYTARCSKPAVYYSAPAPPPQYTVTPSDRGEETHTSPRPLRA